MEVGREEIGGQGAGRSPKERSDENIPISLHQVSDAFRVIPNLRYPKKLQVDGSSGTISAPSSLVHSQIHLRKGKLASIQFVDQSHCLIKLNPSLYMNPSTFPTIKGTAFKETKTLPLESTIWFIQTSLQFTPNCNRNSLNYFIILTNNPSIRAIKLS